MVAWYGEQWPGATVPLRSHLGNMYRMLVSLYTFADIRSLFRLQTCVVILRVRERWICAPDSTVIHKPLCHSKERSALDTNIFSSYCPVNSLSSGQHNCVSRECSHEFHVAKKCWWRERAARPLQILSNHTMGSNCSQRTNQERDTQIDGSRSPTMFDTTGERNGTHG